MMKKISTTSSLDRFLIGLILTFVTTALYFWQKNITFFNIEVIGSVFCIVIAHALAAVLVGKLLSFLRCEGVQIFLIIVVVYSCIFTVFSAFFLTSFNGFLLFNGFIAVVFFCIEFWWRSRSPALIAYIPLGDAVDAYLLPGVQWLCLESPVILPERSIQALVVDLHSQDLGQDWQKFLEQITLSNIPVYHIRQVEEFLTGRVKITHIYENNLGSLLPSPVYILVKQVLDIILIVISLPITLPFMLLAALAIKIESPKDSVFFTQKRVGQYGKEFTIYKFRSMVCESEKDGAQFAQINDTRITFIGHFLRKIRLDELPQFWNILKGEMSLVGPRPEQKVFVDEFEQSIPFYQYRHIVKPGLTGWAQVMQGYVSNVDGTRIKLSYDFFYIKNYSFLMDILVLFKTVLHILRVKP